MSKNFFEVKNVDFNVSNKTKVKNVSFSIEKEGDIICLLGPSGIGKTTILRTIAGLEKIKKGYIENHQTYTFIYYFTSIKGIIIELPLLQINLSKYSKIFAKKLTFGIFW